MRLLVLLACLAATPALLAQEAPKKDQKALSKKKKAKPGARAKPTPEQIRRFNELQKKQQS